MMITRMSLGLTSKLLAKDFRLCSCSLNTNTHTHTHTHTHAHFLKYSENDPILGIYRKFLKERFGFSHVMKLGV